MNQITKYIGILAILPLVTVAISTSSISAEIVSFQNGDVILSNGTTDDNTNEEVTTETSEEGTEETTDESAESPSLEEIYANLIRISIKYNELYPKP